LISGLFFCKGDTSTFACVSFNSTYSLNVKLMFLPLTLILLIFGDELTSCGGIESLAPPVGAPIWAQPGKTTAAKMKEVMIPAHSSRNEVKLLFILKLQT
jgi:hypothetical protein